MPLGVHQARVTPGTSPRPHSHRCPRHEAGGESAPGPEQFRPLDIRATGDLGRRDGRTVDADHWAGQGELNAGSGVASLADFVCGNGHRGAAAHNGHADVDRKLHAVGTLKHRSGHQRCPVLSADQQRPGRRRRRLLQDAPPRPVTRQLVLVTLVGPGLLKHPLEELVKGIQTAGKHAYQHAGRAAASRGRIPGRRLSISEASCSISLGKEGRGTGMSNLNGRERFAGQAPSLGRGVPFKSIAAVYAVQGSVISRTSQPIRGTKALTPTDVTRPSSCIHLSASRA